jgi:hypothetical protein
MKRLVAACVVGLAIFGCSREPAGPAAPRKLRFAVIPKGLDIPVFNYAKIGAER